MAFGQDFLQGFTGDNSLRDYTHAAKTFLSNGYELVPKNKFLFHVFFNVNTLTPTVNASLSEDIAKIGLMVKTVKLPSFQVSVDNLNQYNRKRLVQTKIDYQPCQITFHDDQGDLVRNMWYSYYNYYYRDPGYQYDGGSNPIAAGACYNPGSTFYQQGQSYGVGDQYAPTRTQNDWGYIGNTYNNTTPTGFFTAAPGSAPQPFFKDIRIYGMSQHQYAAYILINPMITSWNHDTYNYGEGGGIMEHTMDIRYEAVKYYTGAIGNSRPDTYVQGFADPAYYDTTLSPIARPGGNLSVLGQGGLIDTGIGIYEDLQKGTIGGVIGAVKKSTTVYQTWKNANARAVVRNEAKAAAQTVLRTVANGALRRVVFPTPPRPYDPEAIKNITIT